MTSLRVHEFLCKNFLVVKSQIIQNLKGQKNLKSSFLFRSNSQFRNKTLTLIKGRGIHVIVTFSDDIFFLHRRCSLVVYRNIVKIDVANNDVQSGCGDSA